MNAGGLTRDDAVIGLDIGTTKVCTVVGNGDAGGKINILGVGIVPSRGLKKGVVIDVEDTVIAIRDSVERARHMAGIELHAAVAGVTGDHIQSSNRRGTVTVAGPEGIVTADDVDRVLQAAALDVPRDREIIHSLPRDFSVDGHRGVRRPIGMCGARLEVETHVVTGAASFLQNVVQCVERAGLGVESLVLEPIATSEAVTTSDERELGVALIDIGGGTSDIAVFADGSIAFSAVLPVGGTHVTRDISIGLRTPLEIAERLKIERGVASPNLIPHGEALEVITAGSGERLRLPRSVLGEIIEARMTELFEMARDRLWEAGVQKRLPAGIILTGGGALLPGAVELAGQVFGMPIRLGRPIEITGWSEQVEAPQFATAVGLLRFALRQREAMGISGISAGLPIGNDAPRRIWGSPTPSANTAAAEPDVPEFRPAFSASRIAQLAPTRADSPATGNSGTPQAASSQAASSAPTPFDKLAAAPQSANTGALLVDIPSVDDAAGGTGGTTFSAANGAAPPALGGSGREAARRTGEEFADDGTEPPPADAPWWRKLIFRLRQLIGFEPS